MMALYNNGFPVGYPQIYPNYSQMGYQNPQMQQVPSQQNQQVGFVRVQNENEARMYPVAPGNSVTFINENAPYCYTKSVDMSQLDRPKFEKYRLVKEDDNIAEAAEHTDQPVDLSLYALKTDVDQEIKFLNDQIISLVARINDLQKGQDES